MINCYKHNIIQSTSMEDVKWNDGFWGNRFNKLIPNMIPNLEKALLDEKNSAYLGNFEVAAGLKKDRHRGVFWGDGDCYKFIEAMAHTYALTKDPSLDKLMDHYIHPIALAQEEDGYINTYIQLSSHGRWTERIHHELYNLGHLLTAAAVHYKATGKHNFLDVGIKAADYLYSMFQPRPKRLVHFGFNPSNIMGAVDIYRVTYDKRYLELAEIFVDMRGYAYGADDQNQNRVPLKEEGEAVGHAVTAEFLYAGAADVYSHNGDKALLNALEKIYNNIVNKKMYITGAVGAHYFGLSSRNDHVHEAFGRDYELPNLVAYNETCANIANAMFSYRMLNITGDSKYGDTMEQVMYNSGLSGTNLEGTRFFYTNPLKKRKQMIAEDIHGAFRHDTDQRWYTYKCYCCPTQILRTIASISQWAYGVSNEDVWVHLYGNSTLNTELNNGQRIRLTQVTQYPWDGTIKVQLDECPDDAMSIYLRIPRWTKKATVEVDGEKRIVKTGQYYEIKRKWFVGDTIILTMEMEPRIMVSNPLVEETRGQMCVMRGPLVYCLESCDLPKGVHIDDIRLSTSLEFQATYEPDLLDGVVSLQTNAYKVSGSANQGDLYYEAEKLNKETVAIKLIPYYAWANRGNHDMQVWLPAKG